MSDKMLKFTQVGQQNPTKRDVVKRKSDFNNYKEFINEKQKSNQADAAMWSNFCQIHCPLSNNIPDWLKLTAEKKKRLMNYLKAQIICQKFVEEYALRTDYVKETV